MCFVTGLPVEDPAEPADKVVGALSLAMDAQDARMAAAKGVSEAMGLGWSHGGGCAVCVGAGLLFITAQQKQG